MEYEGDLVLQCCTPFHAAQTLETWKSTIFYDTLSTVDAELENDGWVEAKKILNAYKSLYPKHSYLLNYRFEVELLPEQDLDD